ncbi:MAG: UvrD-helicase domain-containing protein, partial [Sphingomonadaceae bacterium]|nr:UvrD-helicase domain-containing protein [Sphingomonadaceae bacterium]
KNGNGKLPKTCDPAFAEASERVKNSLVRVMGLQMTLDFAARLAPALALGRRFALEWDDAKKREGFIDFNDQIREAAKLLSDQSVSAWIRYKLDRQFDHVLVDEAQDTNADQWSIIKALTDDYWDGEGQHGEKLRTLFVVGDYKQAIFGFQGTSPENFRLAREFFAAKIKAAAENAARLRSNLVPRELQELDLGQSYRTAQVVLEFVNRALAAIGHAAIGLDRAPADHAGDKRPGLVTLWQPVKAGVGDDGSDGEEVDTPKWLSPPERLMADKIAMQVRSWLDKGFPLHKKKGAPRNAGPGDIMVLVRSRKELAGLIVARLHAAGVPVAGVDRLRLGAPLAVKDLMAALRFAAQPLDDLSLASLLVSPLGGWSQDALLEHGYREKGVSLWRHLRDSREPMVVETVARLRDLLNLADFETPQALLHWILVGPWRGRQKLVARLGSEANDPIDELLNAAHAYASAHTASLQGFIRWFDAGDGELKRENDGAGGLVRVMTVHGSKGLQAPIVILADAVANPDNKQAGSLDLVEEVAGEMGRKVPMLPERKDDLPAPLQSVAEANKAAEMQEHWRLLYVAMTRAEEALYVGGALGSREEEPAANSWFARLVQLFDGEPVQDPIWETAHEWGGLGERVPLTTASAVADPLGPLPDWAANPVGPEPKPPRPLAPSSVGEEQGADPPLPPDVAREAARRGVLLHRLLERLPVIAPDDREEQARNWLTRQAGELDETLREDMLRSALAVLDEPGFAEIFGPDGLAEVPLAAVVEGQVVAGRVDRLLVTDSEVTLVDFKTSRRPPAALKQVPEATLRQMGAYAAALAQIYPGRVIRAALLYTQAPRLIELPAEVLAQRKPGLSTRQESFAELRLV